MIKGRESKSGLPPADLLVCFPARIHLSLMPKLICSPERGSDPAKRHHKPRMVKKAAGRGSHGSPLLWARTKSMESEISEPSSPKVTCAGQIKVRPKVAAAAASCKSWQSVMEEIERIHNDGKNRKRLGWVDVIGFKKDIMQLVTFLRRIKFDFRCFRAFPESVITSDDEDEDEDDDGADDEEEEEERTAPTVNGKEKLNDVFTKWFMVLQEDQKNEFSDENQKEKTGSLDDGSEIKAPPANALLLMRCRSAPAKSWREEDDGDDGDGEEEERKQKEERKSKSLRTLIEEDNKTNKKNKLAITNYDPDSYKISSDVVKET